MSELVELWWALLVAGMTVSTDINKYAKSESSCCCSISACVTVCAQHHWADSLLILIFVWISYLLFNCIYVRVVRSVLIKSGGYNNYTHTGGELGALIRSCLRWQLIIVAVVNTNWYMVITVSQIDGTRQSTLELYLFSKISYWIAVMRTQGFSSCKGETNPHPYM